MPNRFLKDVETTPASSSATLLFNPTYRLDPDDVEAFKVLAARMAATAVQRDGCVFMKVAQDIDEPTVFHLFEGWQDRDAFDAHFSSNEFQGVLQDADRLKILDRIIDSYDASDGQRLTTPS